MGFFNFFKKDKVLPFSSGRPSRQTPPEAAAWYRTVNKETNSIDYVGISNNVKRRLKEHTNSGKFNSETHFFEHKIINPGIKNVTQILRSKEVQKISKYGSKLNLNKGGGGRYSKENSDALVSGGKVLFRILKKVFKK